MPDIVGLLNSPVARMIAIMVAVYYLTQGTKRYTPIKGSAVDAFLPTIPPLLGGALSMPTLPYGLAFNGVVGVALGGLNVAGYMLFVKLASMKGLDLGASDPKKGALTVADPAKVFIIDDQVAKKGPE